MTTERKPPASTHHRQGQNQNDPSQGQTATQALESQGIGAVPDTPSTLTPQTDEKAVPPRRTRTAPASRSGARDAPSGGSSERQQRTCAGKQKGKKAERQIVHTADPCGAVERFPSDAQTVAKPEAVAQPTEPFYPAQAQRAGGGVCYKQTISRITPDPDSPESRDTAETSKEISIYSGGDINAPAGGDINAPPERPRRVKKTLPPPPDIQGITLGIVLKEIEEDRDLTASQALVLIVIAKAIISARGATRIGRAILKRETVMQRAKVGCLRSLKRIMAHLRPAYIVTHPAQRAQWYEFSPEFVVRLCTRLGVTKMHRQKSVTVTPDPFKPARRNRSRSVDPTTPPTPDEERGAIEAFAAVDAYLEGKAR